MKFIRDHAKQPFFAYLPYTPSHESFDIPDSDPAWALYKDKTWSPEARRYAAMVTMLDRQVGEFMGWTAVRQAHWRVVKPARATVWELYDLSTDPGETKDVAAANPAVVAILTALAAKAHTPVQEGTFTSTERHERDRRAKFGKQDDPSFKATAGSGKKKS